MRIIPFKDRDLNAIEPSCLDLFELRVVLLGNVSSPQKQIHTDFHDVSEKGQLGGNLDWGNAGGFGIPVLFRESKTIH